MSELVFEVVQEADGGYCAECLTENIFTQADTWEELRKNVLTTAFFFDRPGPYLHGDGIPHRLASSPYETGPTVWRRQGRRHAPASYEGPAVTRDYRDELDCAVRAAAAAGTLLLRAFHAGRADIDRCAEEEI